MCMGQLVNAASLRYESLTSLFLLLCHTQGLRGIPTAAPGTPGGGGGVGGGLNFDALAMRSEGFSGAEMSALCREAAMSALSKAVAAAEAEAEVEVGKNPEATAAAAAGGGGGGQVDEEMGGAVARAEGLRVGPENFDDAFKVVKASITAEQKEFYRKYAAARRSN
jgi:SpoVK/Ycf46/Vps4 family AAA+-type ATPase